MRPLLGSTLAELEASFTGDGIPRWRAAQVMQRVYRRGATSFPEMADLPAPLRATLAETWQVDPLTVKLLQKSSDGTMKFLYELEDKETLESVLIPAGREWPRWTLCVSTQVGCAVRCGFCASGLKGLTRNLSPAEMVGQVVRANRELGKGKLTNVVFMGMGEPFHNYTNVLKALEILIAPWGFALGQRHITVSTSGVPDAIRKFAKDAGQIRLAISLHAATDALRDRLVPLNRRFPIPELLEAVKDYQEMSNRQVMWEYVLLKGVNDALDQARELAELVGSFRGRVNLIPFNLVTETGFKGPAMERTLAFQGVLRRCGVLVTLRRERGQDIAAACGQLRLQQSPG
jgi:23S rRNA (adenine2503-C2)-methyltransferase